MTHRSLIATSLVVFACSHCISADRLDADDASTASEARQAEDGGDDRLIVPQNLKVTALPGGNGVLSIFAVTLTKGVEGPEFYAAVKNVGDIPACSAALAIELFDREGRSVAAGINGLLSQHFFQLTDGSASIAACIAPGDVTLTAIVDLPSDLVIEDVEDVVYRCPYFALDVVPVDGLEIGPVIRRTSSTGTTYAGALTNGFDVAVQSPSVTVFPVNRVGRPLGMAIASASIEVLPSGSWTFETSAIRTSEIDFLAYPAGALAK